jgi:NAD(P)-dependent dehydrogenase (short-subunit alcohol dehydrogenase family)
LKRLDVSKIEDVNSWIKEVVQDHGRLDGAANIAGMAGGEGQVTEDIVRAGTLSTIRVSGQYADGVNVRSKVTGKE